MIFINTLSSIHDHVSELYHLHTFIYKNVYNDSLCHADKFFVKYRCTYIPNRHMKTYCIYNEKEKDTLTCLNTTDTSNNKIQNF